MNEERDQTLEDLQNFWTDPQAQERLTARVLDARALPQIREISHGLLRGVLRGVGPGRVDLETTGVMLSVFGRLLLSGSPTPFKNQTHFIRVFARIARNVLVDHIRKRDAQQRGGGWQRKPLEGLEAKANSHSDEVLQVHEYLEDVFRHNPFRGKVLEVHYFGEGFSPAEIALILSNEAVADKNGGDPTPITTERVEKELRLARAELYSRMRIRRWRRIRRREAETPS